MKDEKEYTPQVYGQLPEAAAQKGISARKKFLINLIYASFPHNITPSGKHY